MAHGPSGAFRWAIWASSMWACAIWASPMWACATWASSRASGLDNCCCLLLCALPWLGWLARCALPCQLLFRNNNTAAFGGRRRLRRRCCCCWEGRQDRPRPDQAKAGHNRQASQAKAGIVRRYRASVSCVGIVRRNRAKFFPSPVRILLGYNVIYDILDVTRAYPCTEASRTVAGENRAKRHRDQYLRTVTLSSDTGPAILNATVALKQA